MNEIEKLKHDREILLEAVRKEFKDTGSVYLGHVLKTVGEEDRWGVVAGHCTADGYEEWASELIHL